MSDGGDAAPTVVDVVIVGAGFAGLYAVHRLRRAGLSIQGFEAAPDVGGTWYWNRYPGARCDVRSVDYSFSFSEALQQAWHWSHRYAAQPEILQYANHVADRFDLRRSFRFSTRVASVRYDDACQRWHVRSDRGDQVLARFCVMASGCLSVPRRPDFAGLDDFAGRWFHTGHWPQEPVDFTGQRVGVIGTGSSGIQVIPEIARQARHLVVFQRTPHFTIPARNQPTDAEEERRFKAQYAEYRRKAWNSFAGAVRDYAAELEPLRMTEDQRRDVFEALWAAGGTRVIRAHKDVLSDPAVNDVVADFIRGKIREVVRDPVVAERLTPRGYPVGTKRICLDTDYYETYNRPNVTLVDVRAEPIERLTRAGLRTREREYPLDSLVFATGFDALTGALLGVDIAGRDGRSLKAQWAAGPRTLLGLMTAGFPNLFILNGPGCPAVLANPILGAEFQVDWIAGCIAHLDRAGAAAIDATAGAQERWVAHVNEVAHRTLYPHAQSWYMGANVPGKPRVFMPYIGGFDRYQAAVNATVANGYTDFELLRSTSPAPSSTEV